MSSDTDRRAFHALSPIRVAGDSALAQLARSTSKFMTTSGKTHRTTTGSMFLLLLVQHHFVTPPCCVEGTSLPGAFYPADSRSVLPVPPVATSHGVDTFTLSFRAGKVGARWRVRVGKVGPDRELSNISLGIEKQDCPDSAEGACRIIFKELPPNASDCGVFVGPGKYAHVNLRGAASNQTRWLLEAQKPQGNCWKGKKKGDVYSGRVLTDAGPVSKNDMEPFEVTVVADSHLMVPIMVKGSPNYETMLSSSRIEMVDASFNKTVRLVAEHCARVRSAFVLQMGDPFDLHTLGAFMPPLHTLELAETCWGLMSSRYSKALAQCGPIYNIVGNWEGETACAGKFRELAQNVRSLHFPVAEKSNPNWYTVAHGPLLVVVLHVLHSSPKCHSMNGAPKLSMSHSEGLETDFSLGSEQRKFVEQTLRESTHEFKVIALHHPFGGSAGDVQNTRYGRGGAKAAKVGEQKWLHELMVKTGTQVMLHAHDHLFYDGVVDNVHYTCTGTTSAPWVFQREGGYPVERPGWNESTGYTRLKVSGKAPARRLDVRFIAASGADVGGYHIDALAKVEL